LPAFTVAEQLLEEMERIERLAPLDPAQDFLIALGGGEIALGSCGGGTGAASRRRIERWPFSEGGSGTADSTLGVAPAVSGAATISASMVPASTRLTRNVIVKILTILPLTVAVHSAGTLSFTFASTPSSSSPSPSSLR
jgi:hypothetical protein